MTAPLTLEDASGTRPVREDELPLALGGPGCAVPLPGIDAGEPVAWLGASGQEFFLQVAERAVPVSCNGVPVSASQWLHSGDRVRVGDSATLAFDVADGTARLQVGVAGVEEGDRPGVSVTTVAASENPLIRPVGFRPRGIAGRPVRRRTRPLVLIAAVLLAALAAAVWFVLSARSVEVRVDPAPERMSVDGGFSALRIGSRYLLLPGTYRLTAVLEGYHSLETALEVTDARNQSLSFTLEKLPGLLAVDSGAIAGARVVVDGESKGITPLEPIELAAGTHQVLVAAARHLDFRQEITMEGGGVQQSLSVELTPGWAEVSFTSSPAGATVLADGAAVGVTPITADLDPGSHELEFRLEGHKSHHDTVTAVADQRLGFPKVTLQPLDGRLSLASDPPGATVTVDGDFRGQAPVELELTPGRTHALQLTKAGHEPASRDVRLESGEVRALTVTLTARQGEVEVLAQPAGAQVYVDGVLRGEARGVLMLDAVPQDIEIRKQGFRTHRTTLTPRPGYAQVLRVTLERQKAPAPATPAARAETVQAQPMVLVPAGSFQMGDSRREPGRRANETLRQVELTRPFYLGAREVSNREFREFRSDHSSGTAGAFSLDADDQPVVRVTWEKAALYCNWLSRKESLPVAYVEKNDRLIAIRPPAAGYRLPLEAEWAWAARYAGAPVASKYAWGDTLPVPAGAGNFADQSAAGLLSRVLAGYDDTFAATAPVDSLGANALGLYHLGGNVAEWMHDVYSIHPAGENVEQDPAGPEEGDLHVIRGAGWMDSTVSELRLTYRDYGSKARPDLGFRIARSAE